jgi:hypothetical protein
MWNSRELEKITEKRLIEEYGSEKGKEYFAAYTLARQRLVEEILPEIKAILPQYTDHGPKHIADVMDNAYNLLSEPVSEFTATDLYCLLLSIILHDSGNIFDRVDHQRKISQIYDYVRYQPDSVRQEKFIILKAVEAHCGEASDGSEDTLKDLDESSHLNGKPVQLRSIAAVLRFADELAEGPHRTSKFMRKIYDFPEHSEIHHKYADITRVFIDRGNDRIALTYHIGVETTPSGALDKQKGST